MNVTVYPAARLSGAIELPASKPHMQRALVFALLSEGQMNIHHPSWSSETERLFEAAQRLGLQVVANDKQILTLIGTAGQFERCDDPLGTDGSGFMFRTMAALACTQETPIELLGRLSIKQRPILQYLGFVKDFGGSIEDRSDDQFVRLRITGGPDFGGTTVVDTSQTSQFLTALLLIGPMSNQGLTLKTASQRMVGEGYIDLTTEMMAERGCPVVKTEDGFRVGGGGYSVVDAEIPSDFTALSYMMAAAVVVPGTDISVPNYRPSKMTSEREFFEAFSRLGAKSKFDSATRDLRIWHGDPSAETVVINGMNIPTVTPALCAAACFADADVTLHGAGHVNLHKCQRLMVMVQQLKSMGCKIEPHFTNQGTMDGFIARGKSKPGGGVALRSYGDHRVLGSLFAAGLGAANSIDIDGAQNMPAGYPAFYDEIRKIGASFDLAPSPSELSKAS